MSGGLKYRCEIVLPEESPYRNHVKNLTWQPFDPPSPKGKKNQKRTEGHSNAEYQLLTEDKSVMVGYFTGPNALAAFKKAFGERTYVDIREIFREGLELTRVYTLYETERHLSKLIHKHLLRQSVCYGISAKRRREVGGVMRALDYNYMRILDGLGNLVFIQREAVYILNNWGYDIDEKRRAILWPEEITFTFDERRRMLSRSARRKGLPSDMRDEARECLHQMIEQEQKEERKEHARAEETYDREHPIIDWRRVFRAAQAHYETLGIDFRTSATALRLIRREFGGRSTGRMEKLVRARLAGRNTTKYAVGGLEVDAHSLVRLACDGDSDAIIALADLLAGVGTKSAVTSSVKTTTEDVADDESSAIPAWAVPERAAILQWADDAKSIDSESPEGQIIRYIRAEVGKGKLNVLIFDGDLYDEIVDADLAGRSDTEIESFPFHTALIRLHGFTEVIGIAVFRWKDFIESTTLASNVSKANYDGYGTAFLTSGGGVELNPNAELKRVAEKLVVYLDCDNAHIETVYVDGGTSRKQTKEGKRQPQNQIEASYVRGSDMITGTQVVIERERRKGKYAEFHSTRRSHFRRGYFARRRIGTREDWHYEKRWIKPTFVHGSTAIVTERRVRRLVL